MNIFSLIISKQKKYDSRNPISRFLVQNYFNRLAESLARIEFKNILEVGSGEGVLLARINQQLNAKKVFSTDIDLRSIKTARYNFVSAVASLADAHSLPFRDNEFDLVVCCEVLEHVKIPRYALREIQRVTKQYCVMTVPNEPLWRLLNLMRGSYISNLGNTPGHINHWGANSFRKLASEYFEILDIIQPFPWTGVLCRKPRHSSL